jgi:hypothetical protein
VHVPVLPPLRDELSTVLARRERVVAVREQQHLLAHARARAVVAQHLPRGVVRLEERVVVAVGRGFVFRAVLYKRTSGWS